MIQNLTANLAIEDPVDTADTIRELKIEGYLQDDVDPIIEIDLHDAVGVFRLQLEPADARAIAATLVAFADILDPQ